MRSDFVIQTLSLWSTTGETIIRKTGKVVASSQLTISALTAGRVQRIPVILGSKIWAGTTLVRLVDTQGSTTFRTQNAWLAIQSAQNTYEIQKKTIEKQIADLRLAQERAALDFSTVEGGGSWTASLQISGLEKNLEKAKFDYDTKVKADEVTLKNYILTAKNVYSDTINLLIDVIDQADSIIHVKDQQMRTQQYIYFAGKSDAVKYEVEKELRWLIMKKVELEAKWNEITNENMQEYLAAYRWYTQDINHFVTTMKDALTRSIVDARYLSEAQLAAFTAAFGGMQVKASGIISSITSQTNALQSFLSLYKDQQQSLATQIAILENDVLLKKSQIGQATQNSSISLESTNNSLDFASTTKDLNMQTLQNALRQAQIALDEANFNAAKLTVKAPIAGEVSDVFVDVGQDVNVGTPLLSIVSQGQEVEVSFAQNELEGLSIWSRVALEDDYGSGEWVIVSIWSVAEKSGNFPVKIRVSSGNFAVGTFVQVVLWAQRSGLLVPINAVGIVDNGVGQITLWDGSALETMLVTLGETFGTVVEIKDALPSTKKLVISDIKNYDSQKMKIIAK